MYAVQGSVVLDAGCGNGKYLGCDSVLDELHVRTKPSASKGTGRISSSSSSRDPAGKDCVKGKGVEGTEETTPDAGRRRRLLNVGFDMSEGLLGIAGGKGHEVVRGDCFDMSCWRRGSFVRPPRVLYSSYSQLTQKMILGPCDIDSDDPSLCNSRAST